MRRFFPFLLLSTLTVVFLLFTGCSSQDEDTKLTIKESVNTCYEELLQQVSQSQQEDSSAEDKNEKTDTKETAAEKDDFQQIAAYLSDWAKANQIDVKSVSDSYVVLSKAASAGYEDAETFTFHCDISFDSQDEMEDSLETAAAAMTALYSAEEHGTLKAIFTLEKNGQATGANALGNAYLKGDNFISLTRKGDTALYNSVAASSDITASKKLKKETPQYTKAYRLVLEGTPYKSPYKYRGDYPNAIKTIGDLLASCQSSSILFELSSFTGGDSTDLYPSKAEAVIVLQENDVESFTKRFEKSYEKVEEYYDELEEPFLYTMEETKLPEKVISKEDTGNIVSLMYTIINGTYLKSDDDEVMAVSNIGMVSTKDRRFRLKINAKSLSNTLMDEMCTIFETTCGLCDIKYKKETSSALWYLSESKSPLVSGLSKQLDTTPSGALENKSVSALLSKNSKLNLVIWGTNKKDAVKELPSILGYIANPGEEQE
ncbi:hypothetical protein LI177_13395 [bacterium 210820-DFI.6.37]|nr:hypothetical protein [bacterium 210820-DFI.6.37]